MGVIYVMTVQTSLQVNQSKQLPMRQDATRRDGSIQSTNATFVARRSLAVLMRGSDLTWHERCHYKQQKKNCKELARRRRAKRSVALQLSSVLREWLTWVEEGGARNDVNHVMLMYRLAVSSHATPLLHQVNAKCWGQRKQGKVLYTKCKLMTFFFFFLQISFVNA